MGYTEVTVRLASCSTFTLRRVLYSVPASLLGERLRVHLYDGRLVLHHGGRELLTLGRLRLGAVNRGHVAIDYRHVIGWLARKPPTLAGLDFRDELLPDPNWRAIYQRLRGQWISDEACKRVVGALKLAADGDRSSAIGRWCLDTLDADRHPGVTEIQQGFRASKPVVSTAPLAGIQHTLADYHVLLREVCHG